MLSKEHNGRLIDGRRLGLEDEMQGQNGAKPRNDVDLVSTSRPGPPGTNVEIASHCGSVTAGKNLEQRTRATGRRTGCIATRRTAAIDAQHSLGVCVFKSDDGMCSLGTGGQYLTSCLYIDGKGSRAELSGTVEEVQIAP